MNWPPPFPNPHPPGCFWHNWAAQFGSPDLRICEQVTCGIISSPINTWSNLAYIIAGIYIWKKDQKFSILVLLLGSISFFGHASNIYPSLILDIGATFSLIGWCLGKNLIRMKTMSEKKLVPVTLYVAVVGMVVVHMLLMRGQKFALIVPFGASFVLWTEFKNKSSSRRSFYLALTCLFIGFFFSGIDIYKHLCHPTSWFQGHSWWHVFTALTVIFIDAHYRTNPPK